MTAGMKTSARLLTTTAFLSFAGCGGDLDAGRNTPHGLLPVDERNPVIILNDGARDNWGGEYAVLLANAGGPPIAGIVATASKYWPNASTNAEGWSGLAQAAQSSGLKNIPKITMSTGPQLVRPADGQIEHTIRNGSAGAYLIVNRSRELSLPWRPLAIVAGTPLTDVADAYLIDNTVVDRVVVVAALGSYSATNGIMNGPNGELDSWADWIVAQKFRYVQVSAYYDQSADLTTAQFSNLPQNALGAWMMEKQPDVFKIASASDQVAVLAVGLRAFASEVQRMSADTTIAWDSTQGPPLRPNPSGNCWLVDRIATPLAASRLWQLLLEPTTFGN